VLKKKKITKSVEKGKMTKKRSSDLFTQDKGMLKKEKLQKNDVKNLCAIVGSPENFLAPGPAMAFDGPASASPLSFLQRAYYTCK